MTTWHTHRSYARSSAVKVRYLAYVSVFNSARAFVNSTMVLYLVDFANLPLAATALLLAADLIATLLAEIPTGIYADKCGRHKSICIAFVLTGLGFLLYTALSWSPVARLGTNWLIAIAVAGEIIISVGFAFQSGALDAWIIQQLRHANKEATFDVLPIGQFAKNISYMTAGVLGVIHYHILMPHFGFFSTFLVAALSLLLLSKFAISARCQAETSSTSLELCGRDSQSIQQYSSTLVALTADFRADPQLSALVIAGMPCYALLQLLAFYWPLLIAPSAHGTADTGFFGLMASWVLGYGARAAGNFHSKLSMSSGKGVGLSLMLAVFSGGALTLIACAALYRSTSSSLAATFCISCLYAAIRYTDGYGDSVRQLFIAEKSNMQRLASTFSVSSFTALAFSGLAALATAEFLSHGISILAVLAVAALAQMMVAPIHYLVLKSWRRR